jgi:hypothetical protein
MSELEPRPQPPLDETYNRIGQLFAEYEHLVKPHQTADVLYDELKVVVPTAAYIDRGGDQLVLEEEARLIPMILQRIPGGSGYIITQDHRAEINAALSVPQRRDTANRLAGQGKEELLFTKEQNGSTHVMYGFHRDSQHREHKTVPRSVPPTGYDIPRWQTYVGLSRPYDADSYGILRAERTANGAALAPDRLAPNHEINRLRSHYKLDTIRGWRRSIADLLSRLGIK